MRVKIEPPAIRMARKMHITRTQKVLLSVFFFMIQCLRQLSPLGAGSPG